MVDLFNEVVKGVANPAAVLDRSGLDPGAWFCDVSMFVRET